MQAWGHARLRHCPVLSEHLNPGLRTRFTPAVGSVYHLSFTQHLQYISVYFFLLSLFGVCANEVSVLTITPCIRSPSCHSWKLMAAPSYLHFSSKTNPQIPLCPAASWPPLLSNDAAIPGGSWPSSLKYVLLSLGHQSVTWMASRLRQGLHSCFLLSG